MKLRTLLTICISLLFAHISTAKVELANISTKELEKTAESVLGVPLPEEEVTNKGALIFTPFAYKENAFPREIFTEELKGNMDLIKNLDSKLPVLCEALLKKENLTDQELLLAVRCSRVVNSKLAENL